MIISFNQGQLGNQLFNYSFCKRIKRNKCEKIISCNMQEASELIKNVDIINIKNKYLCYFLRKSEFIFIFLSKIFLISTVTVKRGKINGYDSELNDYSIKNGMFPIIYVPPITAQGYKFSNTKIPIAFEINDKYLNEARRILDDINKNFNFIAIQIRRTDYKNHSILGKVDQTLPKKFYIDSMNIISKKREKPFFVFLTDDINYVEKNFSEIENKIVSKSDMFIDFSLLSLCNDAVISPSTFSWWAINFNKNRGLFIAPEYWLGWKSDVYYPHEMDLDKFKLVHINTTN